MGIGVPRVAISRAGVVSSSISRRTYGAATRLGSAWTAECSACHSSFGGPSMRRVVTALRDHRENADASHPEETHD